jgi:hypothetical protein
MQEVVTMQHIRLPEFDKNRPINQQKVLVFDKDSVKYDRCGARLGGSKSNAVNLILRLFLYNFFIYDELVMSRVHLQQHKQPTNITAMVMDPLAPPAAWI